MVGKEGMECFMREREAEASGKLRVLYRGSYVCSKEEGRCVMHRKLRA